MKLFKTGINPNNYKSQIGELKEIYTTTISYPATMILMFTIGAFLFGFGISLYLRLMLLIIPIYILMNPRFTYISIHKNGLILKKRFTYKIIKFEDIENVELRNMSLLWNKFRGKSNKLYGLDIYLKNNKRYSYGERERIFNSIRYPRFDSLTRINNVTEVRDKICNLIKTPCA